MLVFTIAIIIFVNLYWLYMYAGNCLSNHLAEIAMLFEPAFKRGSPSRKLVGNTFLIQQSLALSVVDTDKGRILRSSLYV